MVWAAVAVAAAGVGVGALSMAAVRSGCCAAWLERWALLVCRLLVAAGGLPAAAGRVLVAAVAAAGRVLAAVVAAGSADAAIAAVGRAVALDPALVAQPVSNHIRQTQ
jgi:hypothetical protein